MKKIQEIMNDPHLRTEERTSLSSPMMTLLVPQIKSLALSSSLTLLLETRLSRSPQKYGMLLCTSKSQPVNGGLALSGEAPKTWKSMRIAIMGQFLASNAEDNVLTAWRSLKLGSNDSIQRYVDKFWDSHLKATVYRKIDFSEQKQ